MKSYWVVSPNVNNNEATVSAWRQASVLGCAAFMGWKPGEHQIGDRFVHQIVPGDVILIARRHHLQAEIVGFGVVKGNAKRSIRGVATPEGFGAVRKLSQFTPISRTPAGIPVLDVLQHTAALARLHPDSRAAHARVCRWMERLLSSTSRKAEKGVPTKTEFEHKTLAEMKLVDSPKNHQLDYVVRSKEQITKARKDEARLLIAYRRWLKRQGRTLPTTKYGKLQCDGFEKARCNLIEAKSSTSREHIRMAVGQLLDYSFEIEKRFGKPNMAILLPKEPAPDSVNWLARWNINLIWRKAGAFLDNANGQFT